MSNVDAPKDFWVPAVRYEVRNAFCVSLFSDFWTAKIYFELLRVDTVVLCFVIFSPSPNPNPNAKSDQHKTSPHNT